MCKKPKTRDVVIFSIQVPTNMIDKAAAENQILGSISNIATTLNVKVPFKIKHKDLYNKFDERERIESILHILEEEINFDNLICSGVIYSHGPLHKTMIDDIEEVF